MPRVQGTILSNYENSFIIKAAKLWNKLPQNLTEIDVFTVFKKKLEDYLKLFPDQPPVKGYYHTTKNSLLNYNPQNV